MPRPIWTGSVGFGLVNVPVRLFAATEDHGVHFHQFEEGTEDRIRYQRVNERTGAEVPRDRIVRGLDEEGQVVMVSDQELEALAPERSRSIDIDDFVELAEIDPVQYQAAYYLAPAGATAARAYGLLTKAMEETGRVGIAMFVLRGRERLVAVRPDNGVLVLQTMYLADEVRDPADLPDRPTDLEYTERELDTAAQLITSLSAPWDPSRYRSTYREEVERLVESKREGHVAATHPTERRKPAEVVDLMEALEASLRSSRSRRGSGSTAPEDTGAEAARGAESSPGPRRSMAELRAQAGELAIPGRSKMGREELEAAVDEAEAGSGQRRSARQAS